MYTLFIDTHSDKIIVILYKDYQIKIKKEVETNHNHSVTTIPVLVNVLKEENIEIIDLKEIIVVNGPGSFTGIRLGVTIGKTLAYTLKIPIKTISSLLLKATSFSHEEVRIVEREKNGVFLGTFNKENHLVGEYSYVNNSEYVQEPNDVENVEIDYEKIILFAKTLESVNPHAVNPLYVKKIEVQKWFENYKKKT